MRQGDGSSDIGPAIFFCGATALQPSRKILNSGGTNKKVLVTPLISTSRSCVAKGDGTGPEQRVGKLEEELHFKR